MQFRLKLAQTDFMVKLAGPKFSHFGMERLDFPWRDVLAGEVIECRQSARVGGFERSHPLDERRHLMADQAQVRLAGRHRLQSCQAIAKISDFRLQTAEASLQTAEASLQTAKASLQAAKASLQAAKASLQAAKAIVDRAQQVQDFDVRQGHGLSSDCDFLIKV